MQLCRMAGVSELYAVEPLDFRAAAALENGARHAVQEPSAIDEITNGRGVDLVIEATNSPRAMVDSISTVRIGGRVVLVGIPDGNMYAPVDASLVRRKAVKIKTSRRMGDVYPRAIDLVANEKVDVARLVTHTAGLSAAPAAFKSLSNFEDGVIKSVINLT
eukprot:SAG31_NODE_7610_length_1642_cov_1.031108_2_plen_161_part_00